MLIRLTLVILLPIVHLFIVGGDTTSGFTDTVGCPSNLPRDKYLQTHENHCYLFQFDQEMGYTYARSYCKTTLGGDLAMPKTKSVNDFIQQKLVTVFRKKTKNVYSLLIGLNDYEVMNTFRWDDGTLMKTNNKTGGFEGKMGAYLKEHHKFDCGAIRVWDGLWLGESCSNPMPFICQFTIELQLTNRTTPATTTTTHDNNHTTSQHPLKTSVYTSTRSTSMFPQEESSNSSSSNSLKTTLSTKPFSTKLTKFPGKHTFTTPRSKTPRQTFTPSSKTHKHTFTPSSNTHKHTFTPSSKTHKPTFTPSSKTHKHTFTTSSKTHKHTFTTSSKTHKPTFTPSSKTLKHTFTPSNKTPKHTFTPSSKTPKHTFTQSSKTPKHTFLPSSKTPKHTFTQSSKTPKHTFSQSSKTTSTPNVSKKNSSPSTLITTTAPTKPTFNVCPKNLLRDKYLQMGDDKCYLFVFHKELEFSDARDHCVRLGGDLAMPKTKIVNDFLYGKLKQEFYYETRYIKKMWIGLTDLDREGTYKWVDGTPMRFNNFGNFGGNSNTILPTHAITDCMVMRVSDGRWVDTKCKDILFLWKSRYQFICEFKMEKKTTTTV